MAKHRQTPYSRLLKKLHRAGGLPAIKADEAEEQGRLEEHLREILKNDIFRSSKDTLFEHGPARERWLKWAKLEFPVGSLVGVRDDGGNRGLNEFDPVYLFRRNDNKPLDMQGQVTSYTLGGIGELPMVYVTFTKDWQWYMDDGDHFYDDEITVLRRGPAAKRHR